MKDMKRSAGVTAIDAPDLEKQGLKKLLESEIRPRSRK
jgi:hypothetical protein